MALTEPPYLAEDLIDELRPVESRLEKLAVAKRLKSGIKTDTQTSTTSQRIKPECLDMSKFPSMAEVVTLKRFLARMLPAEIVDLVMSYTEYWPHTTTILRKPFKSFNKRFRINDDGGFFTLEREERRELPSSTCNTDTIEDDFLLRTPPLGVCSVKAPMFPAHKGFLSQPHVLGIHGAGGGGYRAPCIRLTNPKDWDCPKGPHPARMVIFEGLSYTDVCTLSIMPSLWCDMRAKNLLVPERLEEASRHPTVRTHLRDVLTSSQPFHHNTILRFDDDDNDDGDGDGDDDDDNNTSCSKSTETLSGHIIARHNPANFVRHLREGDSIGVWARGTPGESIGTLSTLSMTTFEEVRLHVFWAV